MSNLNMHWEGRALVKDKVEDEDGNRDVKNIAMVTMVGVLNWAVFMHTDTGWEYACDGFDTEQEAKNYAEVRAKLDKGGT